MSTTIDNRVVEMKFDNKNFETNAKATLQTLKNLDKSVNDLSSVKGLDNISKAANRTDLSGLEKGVEAVRVKFSALEVIAMTALSNIANRAMLAGERMIKSFTTDNIAKGWQRYADKTSAVQTIMAATANQFKDTGQQMAYVEEQLGKLNWFTDETSFKFTDMVNNIGKFTSAGIDLQSSVDSMQGIAIWAAKSGATSEQASRAMYNLSQAMAAGKLTIRDWMSIENANMATLEFKQLLIDTAIELGTLEDAGNGFAKTMKGDVINAAKGFRDSMQEGWINEQVMNKTFAKYNEFTNVLYEASEATGGFASQLIGYTEEYLAGALNLEEAADIIGTAPEILEENLQKLGQDSLKFGREAFKFAYEAKTFQEAIDYVGEAVSSTWLNTFELIFGNYEEAKQLWSSVADELYELFVKSGEERNELLEGWRELGGREKLFEGFANIWSNIKAILDSVKDAFREIFPPKTAEDLMRITTLFTQFTEKIRMNKGQMDGLQRLFEGLFSILRVGKNVIENIIYAFSPLLGIFSEFKSEGQGMMTVGDALLNVAKAVNKVSNYIAAFVHIVLRSVVQTGIFSKAINLLKGVLGGIISVIAGVVRAFGKLFSAVGRSNLFNNIANSIKNIFTSIGKINIVGKIGNVLTAGFSKLAPILQLAAKGFAVLVAAAGMAVGKIIEFVGSLIDKIKEIGASIIEAFQKGGLSEIFSKIKEHLTNGAGGFDTFITKIREFASSIGVGKIAAMALSIMILSMATSISKAASNFGDAMASISGVAKAMSTTIAAPFKSLLPKVSPLIQFAVAVLALANALKILASIEPDRLKSVIASIATLTVVIGVVGGVLMAVGKFTKGAENLKEVGKAMALFGVAVAAMTAGLALLNASGDFKDAGKKIGALVAIILAFGAVATLMNRFTKDTGAVKSSISFISFALSINVIVKSLASMADLPLEGLREKVILLGGLMVALGLMAAGLGNIRVGSAIGIMVMLPIIKNILPSIVDALSKVQIKPDLLRRLDTYKELILKLAVVGGIMATALLWGLAQLAKGMGTLGVGMLAMALAVGLLGKVAEAIKNAEFETADLIKAGAFIGGLLVLFGIISAITKGDTGKNALKLSVMIIALTAAITVLTGLMAAISLLDVSAIIKGGAVIGGLMVLFAVVIKATKAAENVKPSVLIGIVMGVVILAAELIALSFIPWQSLLPAVLALGAVMLALSHVLKSIGKAQFNAKALIGIIGAIVMFGAVGAALYILQDIPWQNMLATGAALSVTLLSLALACKLVSGITKSIDNGSVMMLVAVVIGLAGAITILSMIATDEALKNAIALSAVMVSLGVMAKLISGIKFGLDQFLALAAGVGAMAVVVVMLAALAPVLQNFAIIDWESIGKAGAVLAGLTAALFVLSLVGASGLTGAIGLAAIAGALWLMVPVLQSYQALNWETIGMAGAVLGGLTVALFALGLVGLSAAAGAVGMIIMAVALGMIVPVLMQFSAIDWNMMAMAGATLLVMTVALMALALVGPMALVGAVGLILLAVALQILAPALTAMTAVGGEGVLTMAGALVVLIAALAILGALSGILAPAAGILILLSVSLMLLGAALNMISGANPQMLATGLAALGPALIGVAVGAAALAASVPALIVAAIGLKLLNASVQSMSTSVAASVNTMVTTFTMQMMQMQMVAQNAGMWIRVSLTNGLQGLDQDMEVAGKSAEMGFRNGIDCHSEIGWAKSIGNWVSQSLGDGIKANEEAATGAASGLAGKIGAIFSKLAEGIKNFLSGLGGVASGLGDFASGLEEVVNSGGDFESMLDGLENKLTGTHIKGSKAAQSIDALLDQGLEPTNTGIEKLIPNLDDFNAGLENLGGGGGGGGGGSAGQATSALGKLSDTIRGQIDIFSEWSQKSEISAQQMLSNMRSQIAGVKNWAQNMRTLGERGIDQGLLQSLAQLGPQGADKVAAFVQMTNEELAEAGSLYQQSLALPDAAAAYVIGSFGNAGGDAAQGFVNGLTPIGSQTQAWAQDGVDGVHTAWEEHSPSRVTFRTGQNIVQGLVDALRIFTPLMTVAIKKLGQDGARTFEEIGKMMVEGFAKGIEKNSDIAKKAAAKVAKDAEAAAEEALAIESPSKVAEKRLGRFFDLGFARGIAKFSGEPINEATSMAKSVADAVADSMSYVDEVINSGIDLNPVITPRLNLFGMTEDMAAVNKMFENKRIGANGAAIFGDGSEATSKGTTFIQNNYSPKALSRIDIYRQTRNQLAMARGV